MKGDFRELAAFGKKLDGYKRAGADQYKSSYAKRKANTSSDTSFTALVSLFVKYLFLLRWQDKLGVLSRGTFKHIVTSLDKKHTIAS